MRTSGARLKEEGLVTTRTFLKQLVAAGLCIGGLSGCRERSRELHIGVSCHLKPWCYIDLKEGQLTGFDVELARLACARLKWKPVFHSISWPEKERLLATHKIDCVWSGFTVTGREEYYTVLGPYASNAILVVTRKGAKINRNGDLAGRTLLAQAGSTTESTLRPGGVAAVLGAKIGRIVTSPYISVCVQRLRDGLGDALAVDEDVARAIVQESEGQFVLVPDDPLSHDGLGVGFHPRDKDLRDRVEKVLKMLETEGVCAKLSQRFFGHPNRFHLPGGKP